MNEYVCIELNSVDNVAVVKIKDPKVMDPSRIEKLGSELMSLAGDEGCGSHEQGLACLVLAAPDARPCARAGV